MKSLEETLIQYKEGHSSLEEVLDYLSTQHTANIHHTLVDLDREKRTGVAEIIFGQNKTAEQIIHISETLIAHGNNVLATRVSEDIASEVIAALPQLNYNHPGRTLSYIQKETETPTSHIAIITAGTSDQSVAEEAAITAEFLGNKVERYYDCGVAGIHRLLSRLDMIRGAKVIIAIAGMEGALPSVLAGLVKVPVIAVPTSVGYGANLQGIATLLAMLNSCANGISVVNIDNGFGAAYNAHLINHL